MAEFQSNRRSRHDGHPRYREDTLYGISSSSDDEVSRTSRPRNYGESDQTGGRKLMRSDPTSQVQARDTARRLDLRAQKYLTGNPRSAHTNCTMILSKHWMIDDRMLS